MLKKAPNTTNFKFKKFHKIKYSSNMLANNTFYLQFGLFGLQSLETASMTAKHIETGRIMLRKFMKKKGKI
jgi:ribosomal protein L16/L10AE